VKPFLPSSVPNKVYQQMASPWAAFEMHQLYPVLLMTYPKIRTLEPQPPLILLLSKEKDNHNKK
jgi:hypothetical protein